MSLDLLGILCRIYVTFVYQERFFFFLLTHNLSVRLLYFAFLNIHCWLNIANITPHGPDDGSVEPKHYGVNSSINLSFYLDYLVINFSLHIVRLQSIIYFHHILNKSWQKHPTRHQLYGHLPPIMKTIQVRQTRHVGHCWRSRDELLSDVLLWTPTYGRAKAGQPARTYIQQLCEDTGCGPEDLPEVMNDREKWRERVRDIRACGTTSWWCWFTSITVNYLNWE